MLFSIMTARSSDRRTIRSIASSPASRGRSGSDAATRRSKSNLPFSLAAPLLALGGHLKNTIALGWGNRAVVSPHLGDMDTRRGLHCSSMSRRTCSRFTAYPPRKFFAMPIPGYATTQLARALGSAA